MNKRLKIIIVKLFALILIFNFTSYINTYAFIAKPYNVIIINSYHGSLTWTNEENEGIISQLRKMDNNCLVHVEYMDWKNYPTEKNLSLFYDLVKYKYSKSNIDLIVTTDDMALKFALENRKELLSNAPVVFCGVNSKSLETITKGYSNYTGVLEQIDPKNTVRFALKINPQLKNLYIIYDTTESGMSTGILTINESLKVKPDLNIISLNNYSYEDLVRIIENIPKDSAIIYTSFYSDNHGANMDFEDSMRLISSISKVPVFHLYDFAINNGAIGGSMLSGKMQGEEAGRIAAEALTKKDVSSIPISTASTVKTIFDYNQLKKFNVSLKSIPKDSEIINKPFSFIETYKNLVILVSCAFIILIAFIYILLIYIRRIRKYKLELTNKNDELQAIYEELYASNEELQAQYTELSEAENKLHELAYHDFLTGLPNKLHITEQLDACFSLPTIRNGALVFIDADNFKLINDSLGHTFGDKLISAIGARLKSFVNDDRILSRISGDEFVLLIRNIENREAVKLLVDEILDAFKQPFEINDTSIIISSSIGVALYPEHGKNADELLSNADIAMYEAKKAGKAKYVFFTTKMNEALTHRINIEKHLRDGILNNEFLLYYQPKIDIRQNTILGFEALIRWNSPQLGFVPPNDFISIAEESHLIIPLGEWILKEACRFIKSIHEKGYPDYTIAVNISVLQLIQDNFIDMVFSTLDRLNLSPKYLELEITESVLMESYDTAIPKISYLKNHGIGIALDDFGQGYSSLNYLKQMPISTLKIDRGFIKNISTNNVEKTLTGSIISMGHTVGLDIVAEGVETTEQLEFLMRNNCDIIQGYLYSKPLCEEDAVEYIKKYNFK